MPRPAGLDLLRGQESIGNHGKPEGSQVFPNKHLGMRRHGATFEYHGATFEYKNRTGMG
jgi:hypothetical protein